MRHNDVIALLSRGSPVAGSSGLILISLPQRKNRATRTYAILAHDLLLSDEPRLIEANAVTAAELVSPAVA